VDLGPERKHWRKKEHFDGMENITRRFGGCEWRMDAI
jgi:hypothetical protein